MAAAESLAALKKMALMPPPENLDPRISGYLSQQDRLEEMTRNMAKSGLSRNASGAVTSGFASGATPADASILQADIAGDPDFGVKARDAVRKQQDTYDAGVAYEQPEAKKMRDEDAAQKMALAAAPEEAKSRGSVLEERVKQAGMLDLLKQKQSGESELVKMFSRGNTGDPSTGTSNVKMTLGPQGPSFQQIPITNQTRQMSETANDILDLLDKSGYEGQAQTLHDKGMFSPGIGIARRYLAHHGLGTLAGVDDRTASDMGQFETTHDLLLSAIARAHAGARGAGNTGMAERFDKLLASQGDLPTFLGQLKGMRGLLNQYAQHTNPGRASQDQAVAAPESDDLGAGF